MDQFIFEKITRTNRIIRMTRTLSFIVAVKTLHYSAKLNILSAKFLARTIELNYSIRPHTRAHKHTHTHTRTHSISNTHAHIYKHAHPLLNIYARTNFATNPRARTCTHKHPLSRTHTHSLSHTHARAHRHTRAVRKICARQNFATNQ